MQTENKAVVLVGLGGHALVVLDALHLAGRIVAGYCDREPKELLPNDLSYFGREDSSTGKAALMRHEFLVTIGDNALRKRVSEDLKQSGFTETSAVVHTSAIIGSFIVIGAGTQVQGGVIVNAVATIGRGVILNTGCIVEHECVVGDFAHIAPGAVLAGNVRVGAGAFIGANATVIQGVTIGENAIVGAGAVVLRDVPPGCTVVGNPAKIQAG